MDGGVRLISVERSAYGSMVKPSTAPTTTRTRGIAPGSLRSAASRGFAQATARTSYPASSSEKANSTVSACRSLARNAGRHSEPARLRGSEADRPLRGEVRGFFRPK
jgi:hypothetical protein